MYCTGPLAQSRFSADSCAKALVAMIVAAAQAIRMRELVFIDLPRTRIGGAKSSEANSRAGSLFPCRSALLVEAFHLVVEPVHLRVDLFLFEDAFADQQRGQAVEKDPVVDDHLLDLLVLVIVLVVLLDLIHRALLVRALVYH